MAIGTILGIAQAGLSIAGAASGASAQNKAYREAKKAAEKQAKVANKYNKKKWKKWKKHTKKMRDYNFETAMTRWRYQQDAQKAEWETQKRAYNKDQQNLANTLKMNKIGARQGYVAEQRVMRDIMQQQTFERTDQYINSIQQEGRARLGSAGQSSDRAVTMTAAEHGRNLAIMDASFTSAIAQHDMNMFDIALNKFGADLVARANAMLKPEELPEIPQPTKPPLPKFIKPKKIDAAKIMRPNTQATWAQGISGAVSSLAGIAGSLGSAAGSTPSGIPGGGGLGGGTGGWTYGGPSLGTSGMSFDWG